jgi:hypothetical protein
MERSMSMLSSLFKMVPGFVKSARKGEVSDENKMGDK